MEKILKNSYFLVGLALTASLLWPFFVSDTFTYHDDVQIIRLHQMHECIKDLQLPCRWVPDLGGGYGYPLFNYYGPLPYYFGEVIYLITGSLLVSVKVMFIFSFLGSFVFMYLCARKIWGELGGSLSAIFYSLAPYHAVDLYVRGAMGELWALMFFPALLWSVARLKENKSNLNLVINSLVLAALITSHNLSAMIFMPVYMIFILIYYLSNKDLVFIKRLAVSTIVGFLLAAFYFLPALFEQKLVHVETTTYGYFSYTEHFKGFRKLFLDTTWGWGASVREVPGGERDGMSFQIGLIHLLAWLGALPVAYYFWKQKKRLLLGIFVLLTLGMVGSILMIHPRSVFIWDLVGPLKFLQFPWRFLMLVTFFLSLSVGAITLLHTSSAIKKTLWIALVLVVVGYNFNYFRPEKFISTTEVELLTGMQWERQIKRSIFDYLPKSAKFPPRDLVTVDYQVLSGTAEVVEYAKISDQITMIVKVQDPAKLQLSQYYFPEWRIFVDDKPVEITSQNDLGLMEFNLPAGEHRVYAKLFDTPIRLLGNYLTLIGLATIVFLVSRQRSIKYD
jgi:hypothetical protein